MLWRLTRLKRSSGFFSVACDRFDRRVRPCACRLEDCLDTVRVFIASQRTGRQELYDMYSGRLAGRGIVVARGIGVLQFSSQIDGAFVADEFFKTQSPVEAVGAFIPFAHPQMDPR